MPVNRKCIIRLSRYKNALQRLKALGFVKVFSDNLADAAGATPSQVRKDFSLFGITGNRRGGYVVDELIEQLREILGKNETQKVVLAGVGNIGRALMRYEGFGGGGISILAAFDIDPAKFDENADIPILPLERMHDFISENDVKIGILSVPDVAAQQVSELMQAAGIKGILNFAPIQLRGDDGAIINSINLEVELENLIYFVNAAKKGVKE
ncbi:Redox-sensing transcriptional repressor rex [Anaerohalosphaera lusitana]|uniref:Redox-sensing transcriptional repressor Rex n=1 Tax=Anaerohalosphaera lusitana TaxID=1936003 RepID=A0A1U9NK19_9BACT|nr:redox-sensing transcriptional repressor Rex [Anaerohalosphaera lusitana]AQT68272.1 Redox-sensing transcriptional repressor rex [Anaerohalosphaera lusitana]